MFPNKTFRIQIPLPQLLNYQKKYLEINQLNGNWKLVDPGGAQTTSKRSESMGKVVIKALLQILFIFSMLKEKDYMYIHDLYT